MRPNEFLENHVRAKHRPTVEAFQALVSAEAPNLVERIREPNLEQCAALIYWNKSAIFTLIAEKSAVVITFEHGSQFLDPHALLVGSGKTARVLKISKPDDFPAEELSLYVSEAVRVDELE